MTRVTLVVSTHCDLCDHAAAVLDRLTQEMPLDVEILPLDSPRGQEVALASGMAFPPAVLIEGQPFSYGRLSERKLRRELARRGDMPRDLARGTPGAPGAARGTLGAKDDR